MSTQERRVVLLSPGDPEQRTGGYLYNKRLVQAWTELGFEAEILPLSWPLEQGDAARVEALPADVCVLADGLLWESLRGDSQGGDSQGSDSRGGDSQGGDSQGGDSQGSDSRGIERPCAVLVHSLRAWEPGQPHAALQEELAALARAQALICTGPEVQALLAQAGLESVLALPGTQGTPGPAPTGAPHLLCAATVTERKGHLRLLDALAKLQDLPWTLSCVGSLSREPQTAKAVLQAVDTLGLTNRVRLLGESRDMGPHYHRAHALVHTAHHEAFGMVLSEAVAHGRPVLSTPAGALQFLPSAAVLPLDARLAGLGDYLRDPALRQALYQGAQGAELPTWADTARIIWRALERPS